MRGHAGFARRGGHTAMLDRPTTNLANPSAVPPDDQALLDAYSRAVIDVVERVGPAVVRLDVASERRRDGTGSGGVVAADGPLLPNNHAGGDAGPPTAPPGER